MLDTPKMKQLYQRIQKQLFYMIPEKWDKIYLYASVVENANKLEVGEMFFYYYPKGVFKKNPVNVYEIAGRFNIDEDEYTKLVDNLYSIIKELRIAFYEEETRYWSNITIKIEGFKFIVEYNFDDLVHSRFSANERHIIWQQKFLNLPIERLERKDRIMVEQYFKENQEENSRKNIYEEPIYRKEVKNIIEYDREDEIQERMEEARLAALQYEEEQKTKQELKRERHEKEKEIKQLQKRKKKEDNLKQKTEKATSVNLERIEQIKRRREINRGETSKKNLGETIKDDATLDLDEMDFIEKLEQEVKRKKIKQKSEKRKKETKLESKDEIHFTFSDSLLEGNSISLKPMDEVLKRKKENSKKEN